MATRVEYYIKCDDCGEAFGHSHTEATARKEALRHGWVSESVQGGWVDLCFDCANRQYPNHPRTKQQEVQA